MADERPKWTERTGGAPLSDDSLEMTELAGGVDEGVVDLGDDVNRSPTNTEGVLSPPETTQLEAGLDTGVTDLGEDTDRVATEG
jgi:hypothetical protein